MQDLRAQVEQIKEIAERNDIEILSQVEILNFIWSYSTVLPIIGAFNAGKSSVLNALLGQNLLPTGIIPQVCPPVELMYGDNSLSLIRGEVKQSVDLSVLRDKSISLDGVTRIELRYKNALLNSIQNIKIVDLPGYGSGIEKHDRWIRNYLLNCNSYLLVVAADEPTLKHSFIQMLQSFPSNSKQVFVLLTKCDKIPQDEVQQCKKFISDTIKKFLAAKHVWIAAVSIEPPYETFELKELLHQLNKYLAGENETVFSVQCLNTCRYLKTVLKNEVVSRELTVPERQSLLYRYAEQVTYLKKSIDQTALELESSLLQAISDVQKHLVNDMTDIVEPIRLLGISGQDIKSFIIGLLPAFINKEIRFYIFPLFSAQQKKLNSLFVLSEMEESQINIEVNDLISEILAVVLEKEEYFLGNINVLTSRINRKVKKEDAELIIAELLVPEILNHIEICIQGGLSRYIISYKSMIHDQLAPIKNAEERMKNSLSQGDISKSSDNKKCVEDLKKDIEILDNLINIFTGEVINEGK